MALSDNRESIIRGIGWFFLILGIITVIWFFGLRNWRYGVWFCNHAMIITGIAVLKKNRFWLTAMLNWALIPVGMWIIDFLGKILFGKHIFGITEYLFTGPWWEHLISYQHLITVPLMLYAMHLLGKPHRKAWIGTLAHGAVLWIISYFFITSDYNVNCVHTACVDWLALPGYVALWPIIALLMFTATNLFLIWMFSAKAATHPKK